MQVTLLGLWLVPVVISVYMIWWRFVLVSCSAERMPHTACTQLWWSPHMLEITTATIHYDLQVWLAYSGITGYMIYACSARKRIASSVPRLVR